MTTTQPKRPDKPYGKGLLGFRSYPSHYACPWGCWFVRADYARRENVFAPWPLALVARAYYHARDRLESPTKRERVATEMMQHAFVDQYRRGFADARDSLRAAIAAREALDFARKENKLAENRDAVQVWDHAPWLGTSMGNDDPKPEDPLRLPDWYAKKMARAESAKLEADAAHWMRRGYALSDLSQVIAPATAHDPLGLRRSAVIPEWILSMLAKD